jgi:2-aminoadipate transaminase
VSLAVVVAAVAAPPQFAASVVASAIELGFVEAHLRALKRAYAAQLRAVTAALRAHLPAGCAFRAPRGGYFVWVRLPAGSVASEVLAQPGIGLKAMAGPRCSPGGRAHHECLRLCFARCGPAELEEGCRRLGAAIHRGTS